MQFGQQTHGLAAGQIRHTPGSANVATPRPGLAASRMEAGSFITCRRSPQLLLVRSGLLFLVRASADLLERDGDRERMFQETTVAVVGREHLLPMAAFGLLNSSDRIRAMSSRSRLTQPDPLLPLTVLQVQRPVRS